MNKGKASKICNTLVKAIRYYFKSNNTLYKRCFGTFSKYTGAQWAVIFGVGTPSKVVKAVTGK